MMRCPPRGFTLIEMVVVVAIVGVLASAAWPLMQVSTRRSQEFALREGLRQIRSAIDAYHQAASEGRIAVKEGDNGYPPTLDVLVNGVAATQGREGNRIYFLRRLPGDPFAESSLPAAQTWGLRSYESPPDDPREGRDVFDVYSRSTQAALDGSHYADW